MARKAISKKLRFEVLKRDQFKCRYCGRSQADGADLHIDHVIPVASGGANLPENLVTSCRDCNLGKSANLLDETKMVGVDFEKKRQIVADAASKLKEYRDYEYQCESLQKEIEEFVLEPFWEHMGVLPGYTRSSLKYFIEELGFEQAREAVKIAANKVSTGLVDRNAAWKYFCGVCHTKVKTGRVDKENFGSDLLDNPNFTLLMDPKLDLDPEGLRFLSSLPEFEAITAWIPGLMKLAEEDLKKHGEPALAVYGLITGLITKYGEIVANTVMYGTDPWVIASERFRHEHEIREGKHDGADVRN